MTAIDQPGPMNDLPLLTKVADKVVPDDLPTLTEVVEETTGASAIEDELPILTEAIATEPSPVPAALEEVSPPATLSEADMQRLLQKLEAHIESVFTQKLSHRLEQLQRLAVEQAVGELRAELPQMLRDALGAPDTSR